MDREPPEVVAARPLPRRIAISAGTRALVQGGGEAHQPALGPAQLLAPDDLEAQGLGRFIRG